MLVVLGRDTTAPSSYMADETERLADGLPRPGQVLTRDHRPAAVAAQARQDVAAGDIGGGLRVVQVLDFFFFSVISSFFQPDHDLVVTPPFLSPFSSVEH